MPKITSPRLFAYSLLMSAIATGFGPRVEAKPLRNAVAPALDHVIHVSTTVNVSPSMAYAYFTENELLMSWLTVRAEVEEWVGGKYELFWEPDDPTNNSTIGCRITAMAPGQFLAFQWRSPKQFKSFANVADPLTHVVVSFAPEGSGTRIHLVHSGWRSSGQWEEARQWQENAWSAAFMELERIAGE